MPLNIPLPSAPGEGLLKGIDTGSNLFAKLMNAKYNDSVHPSGDVANAMYVEQLKNQYGEDDPRYLKAKEAHEMGLSARQSLMDYRTQLSNIAPYRAATPEEKLIAAQQGRGVLQTFKGGNSGNDQRTQSGMVSGEDGHTISEDEAQVYNQALGKKTTDAAIRNKIPYAENVKITLDSIDPKFLTQYSGPQGQGKYLADMVRASVGTPAPEFMEYQKALTSAKTLSKQLRQFWGDSIQPSATDKIDQLTNPSYWSKNPEVALQQFEQLKKITEQELQTFRDAGTSPLKLKYDKKTNSFATENKPKDVNASSGKSLGMKNPSITQEDKNYAKVVSGQIIDVMPEATAEKIIDTAIKRKMSVDQVVEQLVQKAAQMREGKNG